jgi:hypothetical protein
VRGRVESFRELSGFLVNVNVERRAMATLAKTLMPLLLMTFIMYASLHFPHGLVTEKVTVAITGALSGAVLLTAINCQLGGTGYTVAVEYAFYVFFASSTLNIVSVLGAKRLRVAGKNAVALKTEYWIRMVFLAAVAMLVAAAMPCSSRRPGNTDVSRLAIWFVADTRPGRTHDTQSRHAGLAVLRHRPTDRDRWPFHWTTTRTGSARRFSRRAVPGCLAPRHRRCNAAPSPAGRAGAASVRDRGGGGSAVGWIPCV